jgi:hypothetical protein
MTKPDSQTKEKPVTTPPLPTPEPIAPAHPGEHRHQHAVIHPADGSVSHTDPGGTIHI